MAAIALFAGLEITGAAADVGRVILSESGWISVGLAVHEVRGEGSVSFRVQWSFDNASWAEGNPADLIGATANPVALMQRFTVKAPYWRLAVDVSGANPVVRCSANALI